MSRFSENLLISFNLLLPAVLLAVVCWLGYSQTELLEFGRVPELGFALSFRFDGLSLLFAGLITGIGFLIQLYSLGYMQGKSRRGLFHLYLGLFMLSMLGLVLAENLLLLFIFWELTTMTSFVLIGFDHDKGVARRNAVQAAVVTGLGGLSLLAAVVLLGQMAGSYELSHVLEVAPSLAQHELATPCLILFLLAAFTKSAQFPFHFWLPGAMVAPTPVSAYLHSATMVKAGIYLLARIAPVFGGMDLWFWTLAIAGGFTALWTAMMALRQTDLKLMLAYSTNTILGALTLLLATGHHYAVTAALLLVLAHSLYKAALFMVVGNIDKATGTREYDRLAGAGSGLLITLGCALVAGLSKAGFPPTMGFLSKEYIYKAGFDISWIFLATLFVANAIMVCLAVVIVRRPFFEKSNENSAISTAVEHIWSLWIPPLILAAAGVFLPVVMLDWIEQSVVNPAFAVSLPLADNSHLALWHGLSPAFILSLATLVTGFAMAWFYEHIGGGMRHMTRHLPLATDVYEAAMGKVRKASAWCTATIQHGHLTGYLLMFLGTLALLLAYAIYSLAHWPDFSALAGIGYLHWSLAALLATSMLIVVFTESRLLSIGGLGVVGFLTTLLYMLYSAPDVAKTQLLVETLLIVFIAIIMRRMPSLASGSRQSKGRRLVNLAVAATLGASVTIALLFVTSLPYNDTLSSFYAAQSYPAAHGRNVVNVILVDFRAFDTLGEALVVVVASLAAWALLRTRSKERQS